MQDIPAYILRPLQEYVLSTSETEFGRLYFSWTLPSSHAIETDAFYRFLYRRRVGHQRKSVFSDIFRRVGVFGHYFCKDFFRRAAVYLP